MRYYVWFSQIRSHMFIALKATCLFFILSDALLSNHTAFKVISVIYSCESIIVMVKMGDQSTLWAECPSCNALIVEYHGRHPAIQA